MQVADKEEKVKNTDSDKNDNSEAAEKKSPAKSVVDNTSELIFDIVVQLHEYSYCY